MFLPKLTWGMWSHVPQEFSRGNLGIPTREKGVSPRPSPRRVWLPRCQIKEFPEIWAVCSLHTDSTAIHLLTPVCPTSPRELKELYNLLPVCSLVPRVPAAWVRQPRTAATSCWPALVAITPWASENLLNPFQCWGWKLGPGHIHLPRDVFLMSGVRRYLPIYKILWVVARLTIPAHQQHISLGGCLNNTTDRVVFQQQKFIFWQFWELEVPDQKVNRAGFSWGLSSACRQPPSPSHGIPTCPPLQACASLVSVQISSSSQGHQEDWERTLPDSLLLITLKYTFPSTVTFYCYGP